MWVPPGNAVSPRGRMGHVIARLQPQISIAAAQNELNVITARLAAEDPPRNRGRGARIVPLASRGGVAGDPSRSSSCSSAPSAWCSRSRASTSPTCRLRGRRRGTATSRFAPRSARDAAASFASSSPRAWCCRSPAARLGLALAGFATTALMSAIAPFVPRAHEIGLDWRVFLFLFALCSAVAVGGRPRARRCSPRARETRARSNRPAAAARSAARSAGCATRSWSPRVAIALVLAAGSSLLIRELVRLRQPTAAWDTRNVLTGARRAPDGAAPRTPLGEDVRPFYEIEARAAQLPGVRAAGLTQLLPLQSWGWWSDSGDFRVRGERRRPGPTFRIELRFVTPGYFSALGVPDRAGPRLHDQDTRDTRA
jgi:hypothetical protein